MLRWDRWIVDAHFRDGEGELADIQSLEQAEKEGENKKNLMKIRERRLSKALFMEVSLDFIH